MVTLSNLKQKQAFLKVLVFSLVTVVIWIGFSIFHSQNQTSIPPELQAMALPLNPNINVDVINRIKAKRSFSDQDLSGFTIYKINESNPGAPTTVTSSPSPVPSTSPVPSPTLLPAPSSVPSTSVPPASSSASRP